MDLDPATKSRIEMKLYRNVKNVELLRKKLMKGELLCSIVKPPLIYDPFQIVVAANKALTSEKLTTKSIFTEILFNLSISKNISRSLETFGIGENDKHLLVVTVHKIEDENGACNIYDQIIGDEVPLQELSDLCDVHLMKKIYKISDMEFNVVPLLDSIVSRIATKDFLSH